MRLNVHQTGNPPRPASTSPRERAVPTAAPAPQDLWFGKSPHVPSPPSLAPCPTQYAGAPTEGLPIGEPSPCHGLGPAFCTGRSAPGRSWSGWNIVHKCLLTVLRAPRHSAL